MVPDAPLVVAVAQLSSGQDPRANLAQVAAMASEAKQRGAQYLQLPETWLAMSVPLEQQLVWVADARQRLSLLAQQFGLYVHAGTLALADSPDHRPYASSLLFAPNGQEIGRYNKLHLFDAQVGDAVGHYQESASYHPGEQPSLWSLLGWQIGAGICYDLRFPELARHYRAEGAQVLTYPSAFTFRTGQDHWQPLLQARAIENGCFVLAANQCGWHDAHRQTWGHSLILDPWGQVLAVAGDRPELLVASLCPRRLREVRAQLPSWQHRRLPLSS